MKRNKLFLAALGLTIVSAAGCELLVDFDRTKIDGGSLDGTTPDVVGNDVVNDVVNDVGNDVTQNDSGDAGGNDATDGSTSDVTDSSVADVDDGSLLDADGSADAADE